MAFQRLLNIPSVHNFRDFGNYPAQGAGSTLCAGQLYRSAHLASATSEDLDKIKDLGIGLIVDLRYRAERERQPNLWAGTLPQTLQFPDINPENKVAPHEMFIREALHTAQDAKNYMTQSYASRPLDPGFQQIFAQTLQYMAQSGGPLLIHCAAGKDRTGTLVALIQNILGVPDDIIMQDYMLTLEAVDIDKFLNPAAEAMTKKWGRPYDPEALRPMFGVDPDYLNQSLKSIGNVTNYVTSDLGLSPDQIKTIKKNYLG